MRRSFPSGAAYTWCFQVPINLRFLLLLGGCGLLLSACGPEQADLGGGPQPEDASGLSPFQHESARELLVPVEFTNSIGMRFVLIPPGTFQMGDPEYVSDPDFDEPDESLHEVTISAAFYLQATETTNEQFSAFRGEPHVSPLDSELWVGPARPVSCVTWLDANSFAEWLSESDARRSYRLPTEAEWEYACRAGTRVTHRLGHVPEQDEANIQQGFGATMTGSVPVGSYAPSRWGLFDMHGNVREWCNDWMGPYPTRPVIDPTGPARGSQRVHRGGAWYNLNTTCRCSARRSASLDEPPPPGVGFRLVSPLPGPRSDAR